MTDNEKIDLLLEKIIIFEKDILDIMADLRRLHRDDASILDKVEKIHDILNDCNDDISVHTA